MGRHLVALIAVLMWSGCDRPCEGAQAGATCSEGICDGAGSCIAATCTDGLPGPHESAVDCGGACAPCADGLHCEAATDCVSGACVEGRCLSRCGDAVVQLSEACDDGNGVEGDGCDSNCTVSGCGNGIITGVETCDDSNTLAFDGCSPTCRRELREQEPNDDGVPATGAVGIEGNDFDGPGGIAVRNALAQGALDVRNGDTAFVASIQTPGDEDVFALTNSTGVIQSARVDVWSAEAGFGPGVPCGGDLDLGLNVRGPTGVLLADNNDRNGSGDRCPGLTLALFPAKTVYLHVVENGDDASTGRYGLQVHFSDIICGDGAITPGVEECDDGNTNDADGCSNQCMVPAIDEVEVNDTVAQASASTVQLAGDVRVRGAIGREGDLDVFRFTVPAMSVVRLETFVGTSGDCDATKTLVRVLDVDGAPLVEDLTNSGIGGCSLIQLPLAAGSYFVQVQAASADVLIARYFLELTVPVSMGSESEPPATSGVNDTFITASRNMSSTMDGWMSGDHQLEGDTDVFAVTLPPGKGLRAEVIEGDRATETCESRELDSLLTLYDADWNPLVSNDDGGRGYCSRIDGLGGLSTQEAYSMARNPGVTPRVMYLRITRSTSGLTTPAQFVYRLLITIR